MKKVILCIMDGVGISKEKKGNAYLNAKTPNIDKLMKRYPNTLLSACGKDVGLPNNQMGNSEVGHTNIGAGRVVYQSLEYINNKIKDKTFFKNEELLNLLNHVRDNKSNLHIMGLLSDGGIHSHINHLFAIMDFCKQEKIENIYYHIFMDGRDTSPYDGYKYIDMLENKIKELNLGKTASISGRYYAMDRDNNYNRIEKVYNVLVKGVGPVFNSAYDAWKYNQDNNITDEFIEPSVIDKDGLIKDNDGVLVFNFRPDRIRELPKKITNPSNEFEATNLKNIKLVTMMPVSNEVKSTYLFKLEELKNTLGEYISDLGFTQLRIAETEKYAHVTYFFDGGIEKELKGCKRILIPSSKVATYDLKPEMSAYKITDILIKELKKNKQDLVILNFANGDMVGHTGNYKAALKAMHVVDKCIGKIIKKNKDYTLFLTADHGNCEVMIENDIIDTKHNISKVPLLITDENIKLKEGKLGDIAPSILSYMGLDIPSEMTGKVLINKD